MASVGSPPRKKARVQQTREYASFAEVARLIASKKRIVVLAGAGISVSCGIPDFRSRNGIYSMVKDLDSCSALPDPQCIFDIEYFKDDPRPFYELARRILFAGPKSESGVSKTKVQPSKTHRFISLLEKHKKLLRCYTQNIDGLERVSGVSKTKVRYCHGSMESAKCLKCSFRVTREELETMLLKDDVPLCTKCGETMKPGITFFGEAISKNVSKSLSADRDKVDLLLVIGTSLKVSPMDSILQFFPEHIPQVLINKTHVSPRQKISEGFDIELIGNADSVVQSMLDHDIFLSKGKSSGKTARVEPPKLGLYGNVWLFEGADRAEVERSMEARLTNHANAKMVATEVITCDCCGQQIDKKGGGGLCCNSCFGFDTCAACEDGRTKHLKHFPSHSFVSI